MGGWGCGGGRKILCVLWSRQFRELCFLFISCTRGLSPKHVNVCHMCARVHHPRPPSYPHPAAPRRPALRQKKGNLCLCWVAEHEGGGARTRPKYRLPGRGPTRVSPPILCPPLPLRLPLSSLPPVFFWFFLPFFFFPQGGTPGAENTETVSKWRRRRRSDRGGMCEP